MPSDLRERIGDLRLIQRVKTYDKPLKGQRWRSMATMRLFCSSAALASTLRKARPGPRRK